MHVAEVADFLHAILNIGIQAGERNATGVLFIHLAQSLRVEFCQRTFDAEKDHDGRFTVRD